VWNRRAFEPYGSPPEFIGEQHRRRTGSKSNLKLGDSRRALAGRRNLLEDDGLGHGDRIRARRNEEDDARLIVGFGGDKDPVVVAASRPQDEVLIQQTMVRPCPGWGATEFGAGDRHALLEPEELTRARPSRLVRRPCSHEAVRLCRIHDELESCPMGGGRCPVNLAKEERKAPDRNREDSEGGGTGDGRSLGRQRAVEGQDEEAPHDDGRNLKDECCASPKQWSCLPDREKRLCMALEGIGLVVSFVPPKPEARRQGSVAWFLSVRSGRVQECRRPAGRSRRAECYSGPHR